MTATPDVREPAALVGWELAAVSFVRNYVELHFDGPVWRWFARPTVTTGQTTTVPGELGYRDALCDLIGAEVTAFAEKAGRLSMSFGDTVLDRTLDAEPGLWDVAEFTPWVAGQHDRTGILEWENSRPRPRGSLH